METAKLVIAIIALLISIASFFISRQADSRSRKAEAIKNLLGEKETVAFAALKLLREGLPKNREERLLLIDAMLQACVFERSDRARALLYKVIQINRQKYLKEFRDSLDLIQKIFNSMGEYGFDKAELNLERGQRRINTVKKVIQRDYHIGLNAPD